MRFDLNEDHRMLRDTVREFARAEVAPGAAERDRTQEIPADLVRKMAELGLFGWWRSAVLDFRLKMSPKPICPYEISMQDMDRFLFIGHFSFSVPLWLNSLK